MELKKKLSFYSKETLTIFFIDFLIGFFKKNSTHIY